MILEGHKYNYTSGNKSTQIMHYAADVSDPENVIDVSENDSYDFSDLETPEVTYIAPDATTSAEPADVMGAINKYVTVFTWNLPKVFNNIVAISLNIRAKDPETIIFDANMITRTGEFIALMNDVEDTSWVNYSSPVKYHYYLWQQAERDMYDTFKSNNDANAKQKLPNKVTTTIPVRDAQVAITTYIVDGSLKTSYSIWQESSTAPGGYIVKNRMIPYSMDVDDLKSKTKKQIDEYNNVMYEKYIKPLITKLVPEYTQVYEGIHGDQLRKAFYAQLGDTYSIKLISYDYLDDTWVMDPTSIAEKTVDNLADVNNVVDYLKSTSKPSKYKPTNIPGKVWQGAMDLINDKLPKYNIQDKLKNKAENAKMQQHTQNLKSKPKSTMQQAYTDTKNKVKDTATNIKDFADYMGRGL